MSKTDIGPPDFRQMLPEVIKKNYGKWKYHETIKPGVFKHVAESGDVLYTIRCGSPKLVCTPTTARSEAWIAPHILRQQASDNRSLCGRVFSPVK